MRHVIIAAVLVALVAGCATKRYGRLQPLTDFERDHYTCEDIALELAKVGAFNRQLMETRTEPGAASVAAFFGDFGIGNYMEASAAEKSAMERATGLMALHREKGCEGPAYYPK